MKGTSGCVLVLILVAGRAHAQAVSVPVDAAAGRHPIDPRIYGLAYPDPASITDLRCPLSRWGGNNTSRYNWQQNADNRGADWYFESIAYSSPNAGDATDTFISQAKSGGAQPLLTIPTIGWVGKLGPSRGKLASFSIAKYGPQTGADSQWFPDAGNGISSGTGQPVTGNDPNDASVASNSTFQQGWVQHLVSRWGTAANGGLLYYILDNEPSIWHSTHRDVHPTGATMDEIKNDILDYGARIKAQDAGALIVGPEEWGWSGYLYSGYDQQWGAQHGWSSLPDRAAHGNWDYLPWVLDQLHQHDVSTGQRLLDVFTVHYYPQGGEFGNDTSTAMQLRRNRSTRSLWDPAYVDESWIADTVRLVPRLKAWVTTYYPGTEIGITEYNWGAEGHINGATAQADILGIFGREGLNLATRWTTPAAASPTYNSIKMYRNYDNSGSGFGDTSVSAAAPSPDTLAVFAAERTADGALTIMAVNKVLTGTTAVSFPLANFVAAGTAQVWQLTSSNAITRLADATLSGSALSATLPAQSVTLFVIPPSAAPPALSINDIVAGPTSAIFTVSLSAASAQTVTVAYATADGTATAGADYVAATGTLSFSPGTTAQVVTVQVIGATRLVDKAFLVNLSTPSAATIAKPQGTGTIVHVPPTRGWEDGTSGVTSHSNCGTGAVEHLTSQYVGYIGITDVTFPRVGDIYYSRVVVSTVGNACAGTSVHVEVLLPPSTQFEISAGHPVLCFSTSPGGVTTPIVTGCPQTVSQGTHGWTVDSTDPAHPGPWALPMGSTLEIRFPVRTLQRLSGSATNSYLQSYVQAMDGVSNPWGNSTQPVSVGDKPPGSRLGQGGADFDNDLRADPTVYYQANGLWYVRKSMTASTFSVSLGGTGYASVSGDFDWDGIPDVAVYHQSSGLWFIRKSSTGATYSYGFGGPGFTPVPADYDGDQQTDFAVYHQASGLWYINKSTTLTSVSVGFGGTGYAPVPKDYDGDGKTDLAVYHQASGLWFIQQSSTGSVTTTGFGGPGFVPVPRDYDGDGKADLAVFHPASGLWYIRPSGAGPDIVQGFGGSAYTPVPADYDGDGKADIAVYHEASGLWFIRQSTTGTTVSFAYGGSGFTPVNY
ncbi:MAG TPA: glycoside hydrolase family 44 protein [Vicinamibacteria bacterium]|nr:glycoside hydrolase family 44 protein [Vicinamibacteria bacterium]